MDAIPSTSTGITHQRPQAHWFPYQPMAEDRYIRGALQNGLHGFINEHPNAFYPGVTSPTWNVMPTDFATRRSMQTAEDVNEHPAGAVNNVIDKMVVWMNGVVSLQRSTVLLGMAGYCDHPGGPTACSFCMTQIRNQRGNQTLLNQYLCPYVETSYYSALNSHNSARSSSSSLTIRDLELEQVNTDPTTRADGRSPQVNAGCSTNSPSSTQVTQPEQFSDVSSASDNESEPGNTSNNATPQQSSMPSFLQRQHCVPNCLRAEPCTRCSIIRNTESLPTVEFCIGPFVSPPQGNVIISEITDETELDEDKERGRNPKHEKAAVTDTDNEESQFVDIVVDDPGRDADDEAEDEESEKYESAESHSLQHSPWHDRTPEPTIQLLPADVSSLQSSKVEERHVQSLPSQMALAEQLDECPLIIRLEAVTRSSPNVKGGNEVTQNSEEAFENETTAELKVHNTTKCSEPNSPPPKAHKRGKKKRKHPAIAESPRKPTKKRSRDPFDHKGLVEFVGTYAFQLPKYVWTERKEGQLRRSKRIQKKKQAAVTKTYFLRPRADDITYKI